MSVIDHLNKFDSVAAMIERTTKLKAEVLRMQKEQLLNEQNKKFGIEPPKEEEEKPKSIRPKMR